MGDAGRLIHHASLSELATQLHSKDDREQYARVIAMSEALQKRIRELQRYKGYPCYPDAAHFAEHDRRRRSASTTMELERERQQPLDRYYRLLEHSKNLHERLDRLSNEYQPPNPARSLMDKALPPIKADDGSNERKKKKAGKKTYAPLINTTVMMDTYPLPTPRSPPPHPPPSCPPPPTPAPSLGANSNNSKKKQQTAAHYSCYHYNNATEPHRAAATSGLAAVPEQEQLPPPTPAKQITVPNEQQSLMTPPASPQQQPMWSSACSNLTSSNLTVTTAPTTTPPSLLEEPVPIMRVQRKINGIKGFLTRTYQLSNMILMSRAYVTPLRLFTATDLITGQPKAVLKVSIIGQGATFSFHWRRRSIGPSSSGTQKRLRQMTDAARLALLPDNTVRNALAQWIAEQKVLPPLHQATNILRECLKIYVVFDRHCIY